VLIQITDEGRRLWRESVGAQAKKEALITKAALDEREREELNNYLRRLMIVFEESDPPGWSKH
jgi:DNA-binding MarR family transcriptional regulator